MMDIQIQMNLEFIEYIKSRRGKLNADGVKKGYNPFIPGDPFHDRVQKYLSAIKNVTLQEDAKWDVHSDSQ